MVAVSHYLGTRSSHPMSEIKWNSQNTRWKKINPLNTGMKTLGWDTITVIAQIQISPSIFKNYTDQQKGEWNTLTHTFSITGRWEISKPSAPAAEPMPVGESGRGCKDGDIISRSNCLEKQCGRFSYSAVCVGSTAYCCVTRGSSLTSLQFNVFVCKMGLKSSLLDKSTVS